MFLVNKIVPIKGTKINLVRWVILHVIPSLLPLPSKVIPKSTYSPSKLAGFFFFVSISNFFNIASVCPHLVFTIS